MKTQISKEHSNVVAVQPITKFHKENHMKRQRSTTFKLAILVAMVVTVAQLATAQSQDTVVSGGGAFNPLQIALKAWYVANDAIDYSGAPYNFNGPGGLTFDGSNIWISNGGSGANGTVVKIRASDGSLVGTYAAGPTQAPWPLTDGESGWRTTHCPVLTILSPFSTPATAPSTVPQPWGRTPMTWPGMDGPCG